MDFLNKTNLKHLDKYWTYKIKQIWNNKTINGPAK